MITLMLADPESLPGDVELLSDMGFQHPFVRIRSLIVSRVCPAPSPSLRGQLRSH